MGPINVHDLLRQPSERDFQDRVVEAAQWCGWSVAHFGAARALSDDADGNARYLTPAEYDGVGFPDLVLVHATIPHMVWFRELKTDRTRTRLGPAQKKWADLLVKMGHNYDVWYPSKWDDICKALGVGRVRIVAST